MTDSATRNDDRDDGLGAPEATDFDDTIGAPRFNRRLSDKLLAAFNHAYAVGEDNVADSLRDILARIDADAADSDQRSTASTPLGQADLWMRFVKSRNEYRDACDAEPRDAEATEAALETMKRAYRGWSLS